MYTYIHRRISGLFLLLALLLIFSNMGFAQEKTVSGRVSSEEGPLPGVNIMVQGTTYGNITNLDGEFTLIVPGPESILVFSSVGFKTQHIKAGDRTEINVIMEPDVSQLEEIVVTGYSVQSRKNLSGAVSVVDPDEIRDVPANSVAEQLQGRAAGVNVSNSGAPGGPVFVRIRGYGTISDQMSEPLYIVDGIPLESSLIETLNPNDVASIQILKEAATASIYGARAANGVIIITTKTGEVSKGPEITFDAYTGVQHAHHFPDLLNPDELLMVTKTAMQNTGNTLLYHPQYLPTDHTEWALPDYLYPPGHSVDLDGPVDETSYNLETNPITRAEKAGTDWLKQVFQPAFIQNYNLMVRGGNEHGKYTVSLGYFDQEGTIKHTGYQKLMARINTEFHIKNRFRIGETLGITWQVRQNNSWLSQSQLVWHPAIAATFQMPEIVPVFDIGGNYTGNRLPGLGQVVNPVAQLERGKDNREKRIFVMGSFYMEWDIINDLTFRTSFNPVFDLTFENKIFSPSAPENQGSGIASLTQNSWNLLNWSWYNTLNYQKTFLDSHHLSVLLGSEAIENQVTAFDASREVYYQENVDYRQLDAGERIVSNGGSSSEWSLFSIFGKIDYNFRGKYLFSGTIRRDGSSRFGANNRFGVFPAASVAWRISSEGFMNIIDFINDLKIRAGWGQTGNQQIGDYVIFDTFRKDIRFAGYDIGGNQTLSEVGILLNTFGNPDAKWETTTTTNIGIDFTLLNRQLTGSIDVYQRLTSDMLMQVPQPGLLGQADLIWVNIGEMENKGLDVSLRYQSDPGKEFSWSMGVNFTRYINEVKKLSYPEEQIFSGSYSGEFRNVIIEGQPLGSFYGYQLLGIFQDTLEVMNSPVHDSNWTEDPVLGIGRWKFADNDSSGTISPDDRTIIGSPHPDFTIGIPLNFKYKNFELSVFWYGSYGNEIYNINKLQTDIWKTPVNPSSQKGQRILQSWGMPGVDKSSAALPEINENSPARESSGHSYLIDDGSYLRLRQITLGYSFYTAGWKGVDRFRIYLQGNNLITWTKYTGMDPAISGSDNTLGIDYGYFQNPKSWLIGLNITFK